MYTVYEYIFIYYCRSQQYFNRAYLTRDRMSRESVFESIYKSSPHVVNDCIQWSDNLFCVIYSFNFNELRNDSRKLSCLCWRFSCLYRTIVRVWYVNINSMLLLSSLRRSFEWNKLLHNVLCSLEISFSFKYVSTLFFCNFIEN